MRTDHRCGPVFNIKTLSQLKNALQKSEQPIIVGGGSNILFTRDTDRAIIKVDLRGRGVVGSKSSSVDLTLAAGENWHETVLWTLKHNWGGLENLSLIPGLCGAAPMQNIGAYGVEIGQVLQWVEVLDRTSLKFERLRTAECQLGYRDSIFKNELRDQVVITKICLRLSRPGYHQIHTSYGAIQEKFDKKNIINPTIHDISQTVIQIRRSKLPNPDVIPNTGSFFKNPIVPISKLEELQKLYPDIPNYPVDAQNVKLAAGWLIDRAGWKGTKIGRVGVHDKQALVLVNYNSADGKEILSLSRDIQEDISDKYGVSLIPEVNVY